MESELKIISENLSKLQKDVDLIKEAILSEKQTGTEFASLSEKAFAECWNSPEDEEAFAYLQ
jgi:hypothetical protein|tara:strand:+ start:232 stop:417 length:186 start_codon:yes stop_codon:yes gene_type:complete